MYKKDDIIRSVAGMWPEAIQAISPVPDSVFNKKHQPCISCGGADRFRYDDHYKEKSDGGYICSQCGSGDGLSLLMKISGMPFGETIRALGDWIGGVPVQKREAVRSQVMQKAQQEKYGSYADHDRCAAFISMCERKSFSADTLAAGISPDEFYTCIGKSGAELICVPVSLCSQQDMICDVAFIKAGEFHGEYEVAFMSGGFPASGVSVIAADKERESEYTYLCSSWFDAWHTHHSTGAEVWCCWSPSNVSQVAYRMKMRKLRVSCLPDDRETIYAADDAGLGIISPRKGRWSLGIEKKVYRAGDLCVNS